MRHFTLIALMLAAPAFASNTGEAVYKKACMACHTAGVAGAPKTGDKAVWAARLKAGKQALYTAAIKGKGTMPAKGGQAALSDAEVRAAVDFMLDKSK